MYALSKMLLRIYVDSKEQFARWVQDEAQVAHSSDAVSEGRRISPRPS